MASGVTASRPPAWRRRGLLVVGGTVVLLLVLAIAAAWWLLRGPVGPYADAMATLPEGTLRSSFTDWSRVDEELDVPDVEESQDPDLVREFLDNAYDADLVTGSTMLDVLPGLATTFGYSAAQAEWEAYGQSPDGAVDVLKVDDSVDFDQVAANLEDAGYEVPDEDDGVWAGSGDLVVEFESPMSTLQINVLLLEEHRLVLTSDQVSYLEATRAVVEGDESSLRDVDGVDALIETAEEAMSAQLWSRDFACTDLAMSQADAIDQREGARLVEQAGGVHPLDGLVVARTGGESATIAMFFDSEADADSDLQPRTDLARGPAPGQGGEFTDRFTVEESRADGQVVTMTVEPQVDTLMGDLGQGPVLFATC